MFCPICSATVTSSQNYCRACGFGLEKTAQSIGEQHPTELAQNLRAQNKLERLGVAALSVFGTGVLGLLLYLVGYKLMVTQGAILAALGTLAFVVIAGSGLLSVILFARAKEITEASRKRRLEQPDDPAAADSANLLPPEHQGSISSVTDRTTELLITEREKGAAKHKLASPTLRQLK
jgi:hypothetical protein